MYIGKQFNYIGQNKLNFAIILNLHVNSNCFTEGSINVFILQLIQIEI